MLVLRIAIHIKAPTKFLYKVMSAKSQSQFYLTKASGVYL